MPQSAETSAEIGTQRRDWVLAWRIGVAILSLIAAAAGAVLLFAGKAFVHEAVTSEISGLTPLPASVKSLEEANIRQDRDQRATAQAIGEIRVDLASIKATQAESVRNSEQQTQRILNRLEQLADRR